VTGLHDDALTTLRRWHTDDPRQERLRLEYVAHLEARPDATRRECVPAHLTAGVLILSPDHEQVLLTLHAKARRWFHMGGHLEPQDTTLAAGALREGTEESGVAGLVLDAEPLHLDAHVVDFCGDHEQVRHLDVRFLALAPADARSAVSEESIDVRWWPVAALPTEEPAMHELVLRAVERAVERVQASAASSRAI
jgi:8-oxo-dGTP pyrophosphatase MutT (NUDIX family)